MCASEPQAARFSYLYYMDASKSLDPLQQPVHASNLAEPAVVEVTEDQDKRIHSHNHTVTSVIARYIYYIIDRF